MIDRTIFSVFSLIKVAEGKKNKTANQLNHLSVFQSEANEVISENLWGL